MHKQGMFKHQKKAEIFHRQSLSCEQCRRNKNRLLETHTYFAPGTANPLRAMKYTSRKETLPVAGRPYPYIRVPLKE